MDKEAIIEIATRINNGDDINDIAKELNAKPCYIESLLKSIGLKKNSLLGLYYSDKHTKEIKKLESQKKKMLFLDSIEALWLKRYKGINIDEYDGSLEEEYADSPWVSTKIHLNYDLYCELECLAKENNVEIDLYIEKMLLQMLERNKETRRKTKGRKKYIETMIEGTVCEDFCNEVMEDLSNKKFIKFKDITYTSTNTDVKIYIANYLMNKGYTLKQVEEIAKDDISNLYDDYYCSERLEAHYYYIHSGECNTFQEVEEKLINEVGD